MAFLYLLLISSFVKLSLEVDITWYRVCPRSLGVTASGVCLQALLPHIPHLKMWKMILRSLVNHIKL